MNQSTREVLRYLAGNENIEVIPLDDLQKLADENPYFPVAQLLLATKLKAENNAGFLRQAQKTALYFSNPYWLHFQLTNELWHDSHLEENKFTKEVPVDDGVITNDVATPFSVSERVGDVTPGEPPKHVGIPANEDEKVNTTNESYTPAIAEIATSNEEKVTQPAEEAVITRDTDAATEGFLNKAGTKEETIDRDNIERVIMDTQMPVSEETTAVLEEMAGVSTETDETTVSFLKEVHTPVEENAELSSAGTEIPGTQVNTATVSGFNRQSQKDENSEPDEHERMFQNIKAMLDATTEDADADIENTVIPIDPYYTVDYFASQGIKLDLEQNPRDQLGQHLKKFTQWLKHMKRLGPEDATEVITSTDTEADIQKIAESSNITREVVTEAMASVLEKQGKNEKAIELYKKLSFLNPHKSAYFADKIKNLKGI